jgi:hypothetical protein
MNMVPFFSCVRARHGDGPNEIRKDSHAFRSAPGFDVFDFRVAEVGEIIRKIGWGEVLGCVLSCPSQKGAMDGTLKGLRRKGIPRGAEFTGAKARRPIRGMCGTTEVVP